MSVMTQADVFRKQRDFAELKVEALQAKIDMLMLEYCPKEMTKDQLARWEACQVKVEESSNDNSDKEN